MTGHLLVPALDDAPATISRPILSGLLRGELGFDGLIVTDALEMRGISGTVGVPEAAVLALAAGADALCLGHDLHEEAVEQVHAAIVGAVRSGRLAEERRRGCRGARRGRLPLGVTDGRAAPPTGASAPRLRAARSRSPATSRSAARSSSSSSCRRRTSLPAKPLHGLADLLPDAVAVRLREAPRDLAALLARARRAAGSCSSSATPPGIRGSRRRWRRPRRSGRTRSWSRPGFRDATRRLASIVTHGAGRANLAAAAEALAGRDDRLRRLPALKDDDALSVVAGETDGRMRGEVPESQW